MLSSRTRVRVTAHNLIPKKSQINERLLSAKSGHSTSEKRIGICFQQMQE